MNKFMMQQAQKLQSKLAKAQEELATQQKFTNAARLRTMAMALQEETQEETEEVEVKSKKQLAYKK